MNFFGHATVATWSVDGAEAQAAHVFGAMLPDFAGMVGRHVTGATTHAALRRGIELHHRTDDAFHGAPIFVELCREALQEMEAAGVARASARAVAHVGTELLLDGFLSRDDRAVQAYREAMNAGPFLLPSAEFKSEDARERCHWLLSRLAPAPIPQRYLETDFVAERLVFALAPRPRLALSPADTDRVRALLPHLQARVTDNAEALIASVAARLNDKT